ncbi:homoserine kinase [Auriscalpium vulgare]|uniref:Homoserine kinase n=1 Tax=Auriscalpium vulgare TaxID=40419 RepID=A0ACB8RVI1_9AGAM|nr:homoserine kinase [Auriscalpium vulgare]
MADHDHGNDLGHDHGRTTDHQPRWPWLKQPAVHVHSTDPFGPRTFTIRVPATSANIGPGFDVVGLSLSLYLTLTATIASPTGWRPPPSPSSPFSLSSMSIKSYMSVPSSPATPAPPSPSPVPSGPPLPVLTYEGEGAAEVPLDPYKNLTTRVALYVLRCAGIPAFPARLSIHVNNEIPFGRGLGSSGAAVIAGVLLGSALGSLGLTPARMLDYALMVERHPDNVTAALVGGFVGSYLRELDPQATQAASVPLSEVLPEYPPDAGPEWGRYPPVPPTGIGHYVRFGWAPEIKAIAIIPRFELSTAKAREVLPESYSRKDLVFNLQRLAVLTTALGQSPPDPELIYEAMKDRVHQPYRRALIPGLPEVTSAITPTTHPGLLGICLSGAGPTILALAVSGFDAIAADARKIFRARGVEVDWKVLDVVQEGASIDHVHSKDGEAH